MDCQRLLLFVSTIMACSMPCVSLFSTKNDLDSSSFCNEAESAMIHAISLRDFSQARSIALVAVRDNKCSPQGLAKVYQAHADAILATNHSSSSILQGNGVVQSATAANDDNDCWNFHPQDEFDLWDDCCSQLGHSDDARALLGPQTISSHKNNNNVCLRQGRHMCCGFYRGSSSYLRLPALSELALVVRAETENSNGEHEIYRLEQDGFLRKFDPAAILWPASYFLGLCLATPAYCGIPELSRLVAAHQRGHSHHHHHHHQFRAMELAAGIGLPSISLARFLERTMGGSTNRAKVVVTDKAPHALALAASNARAASVSNVMFATIMLDYTDWNDVTTILDDYTRGSGFDVIIGSALQSLYSDSAKRDNEHLLWKILDALLRKYDDDEDINSSSSPSPLVVLAHTTGQLEVPPNCALQRTRTISGSRFGIYARWESNSSDFEISVLQRQGTKQAEQLEKNNNEKIGVKEEL